MPILHLIAGPVGAGKTTYANRLAREQGLVAFSIDDWMLALYEADAPKPASYEWLLERTKRCESRIWQVVEQLAAAGQSAVLDLGYLRRAHREEARLRGRTLGEVRLHVVGAPLETRRARVAARNERYRGTWLELSPEVFGWAESYFQAPDAAELDGAIQSDSA